MDKRIKSPGFQSGNQGFESPQPYQILEDGHVVCRSCGAVSITTEGEVGKRSSYERVYHSKDCTSFGLEYDICIRTSRRNNKG